LSYLLDTNACISILTSPETPVLSRLRLELDRTEVFASSIVLFELWYGVFRSKRIAENRTRASRLLRTGVQSIEFSADDARVAGEIRAILQKKNQAIGPYDTLIAGQALARGLTLVTANHREFARVDGLQWEDWSQP
jgi:tRNA(fMet)-specific endonuclease VapC